MKSYGTDNLEDGIKIFLIEKIKRVILEADYIEKLENVKKITQHFENLSEKINSFEDVCEEIIKRKYLILLNLKNGDIEEGYLVKKESDYYYFEIVNQELEVISKEIFDVNYLPSDFKKNNGYKRSIDMCAEYDVYRQCYCGCIFAALDQGIDLNEYK